MSDLMLDVDQAGELKAAFRRGDWTNTEIKKACEGDALAKFRKVIQDLAEIVIKKVELLKFLASIPLSAVRHFSAADHFKVGVVKGVKIGWLGENFQNNFLSKVERKVKVATLKSYELLQSSLDGPIIEALGPDHETTLAHLWQLLVKQPNGESGTLLTNGYWNIFYIKDAKGKFWAVGAYWYAYYGGWCVDANSVEYPDRWRAGRRVVSRK